LIAPVALALVARAVDLRTAYLITLPLLAILFALSRRPRTSVIESLDRDDVHVRREPDSPCAVDGIAPHVD
jgi:hypothetical protein